MDGWLRDQPISRRPTYSVKLKIKTGFAAAVPYFAGVPEAACGLSKTPRRLL